MSSFLNKMRGAISLCALFAFLHAETSWSMGAGRLRPDGVVEAVNQRPAQPGQVQPPNDNQTTTVVRVPVPNSTALEISVVEGFGGTNVVGKKSSSRTVVLVRDLRKQPIEGAAVTFMAPGDGPSVLFGDGSRTVTIITGADGRAQAPSMRAVNAGSFKLQVSASFQGQTVSASIDESNFDSFADAVGKKSTVERPNPQAPNSVPAPNRVKHGISGAMLGVIIGGVAAAGIGIALGAGGKSSGNGNNTTTTATIAVTGTPTVSGPH